jgi:hypothetical protein
MTKGFKDRFIDAIKRPLRALLIFRRQVNAAEHPAGNPPTML